MIEDEFENNISQLHGEGKWKEIIFMCKNEDNKKARRLLWVWPSIKDLDWIKEIIVEFNLDGIASIGCGTGLLEWIIQQHSQCCMIGVEVDQCWWESRYSPALYLDNVIFTDKTTISANIPNSYGIFFCYFNNGKAFDNYINHYYGRILIIVGPVEGQYRSTDPLPFDTIRLNNMGWQLYKMHKLDNNKDCIAVYIRK